MTPEDAWREEAYDRMVEEVLETHREQIVEEFVAARMASYYRQNPDLSAAAERMLDEAIRLLKISPSASLVFSYAAIEITLKNVLLKPVAFGMIHDELTGPLITDLVINNRQFTKLLFQVLREYGFDITTQKRQGSSISLWEEMKDLRTLRNGVVHSGEPTSNEQAALSLRYAKFLLHKLYPQVRALIIGENT